MPTSTNEAGTRVRPNREGWARARKFYKLNTDVKLAEALGVSTTTIWRVLVSEDQAPGEDFISKTLNLFYHPVAGLTLDGKITESDPGPERGSFNFHCLFEGPWGGE